MGSELQTTHVLLLLCAINLLNFFDRGLIPGAPIQFQAFVQAAHNVSSSHVSVYIGFLQTSFIGSLSIFVCVFGYLSRTRKPFLLTAIGLSVWLAALILCGLAKPLESFYVLLMGRLVSGIGEASFQATAPAFIDEFAPSTKRTLWLGAFFALVAVGQAIGFSASSLLATTVGWDVSFYLTAVMALPFVYACYRCIPDDLNKPLMHLAPVDGLGPQDDALLPDDTKTATYIGTTRQVVWNPIFALATLGWAAYAFTIGGLSTFAPAIFIGLGVLDVSIASTVMGGIIVVSSLSGALLGGYLLDRSCRLHEDDRHLRMQKAAFQMLVSMTVGVVLLFVSVAFLGQDQPYVVLAFVLLGLLFVLMSQAPLTTVVLLSVRWSQRSYAVGLNTLLMHLLGDVPAVVILGALKDAWAPHCGSSIDASGKDVLDPDCHLDQKGLRDTLCFAYGWLLWAVLFWGGTYYLARRPRTPDGRFECTMPETPKYDSSETPNPTFDRPPAPPMQLQTILIMLCGINFLNFLDRGLIPGAPIEFQAFVQSTTAVEPSHVSIYVGALQTTFIGSFSVFVCIFGYLAKTHRPFLLTAIGLFAWAVALAACGLAKARQSFALLLAGRLVSGIGEASFQATAPGFIDSFAAPTQRALWMGLFYAAAPVGEAVGFAYGALVAATVGWDVGFYTTAIAAVPLAYACCAWIPQDVNRPLEETLDEANESTSLLRDMPVPFALMTWRILKSPQFLASSLGNAAFAFTLDGLATFVPVLYIGLGVLEPSVAASTVGAIVVVAGLLGPIAGGHLLDERCRGHESNSSKRAKAAARQLLVAAVSSTVLLFVSLACIGHSPSLVLAFLTIGLVLAFSAQAPASVLVLLSAPTAQRGYAMGLNMLLIHVLGDMPAGVVLGALKDQWAPHCGSVVNTAGDDVLDPRCRVDFDGLRWTLGFAYSWLGWAILSWGAGYCIALRHESL
ncbi:Major Facilitator Superfamily (MFS) [Achlya hypogyna]|uniref:Major Facilitator Superfamily (MFS) n=1 Tax=Achlya hypogyna TaxID=1202772 RepID=A0A1V9YAC7_ACHHY|nr:Major Facilitator Superfamily (MFS) [Achlya hypogyna]